MDNTSGFEHVGLGVAISTLISFLKGIGVKDKIVNAVNLGIALLGTFIYQLVSYGPHQWRQAILPALVTFLSSHGWYGAVAKPIRQAVNAPSK